ncbi:MAG TPA: DUF5302 domain-containing protein [Trebonia sp.]|nr:DUF5302 domain-containing protein [Trebonia sp.]
MTKSAKQDTTKAPAEPAATESAATQGEAQPETAAEPEEAGEAIAEEDAKPDLDETKRKFREALERKHQAHSDGQAKGGRDGSKINGAHGPAASRRNFRRKSG